MATARPGEDAERQQKAGEIASHPYRVQRLAGTDYYEVESQTTLGKVCVVRRKSDH